MPALFRPPPGGTPKQVGLPTCLSVSSVGEGTRTNKFVHATYCGMGFQPMRDQQNADATEPPGRMPVPLFMPARRRIALLMPRRL